MSTKLYPRSAKTVDAVLIGWTIVCVLLLGVQIYRGINGYSHGKPLAQSIGYLIGGIGAMVGVYVYRRILRHNGKL